MRRVLLTGLAVVAGFVGLVVLLFLVGEVRHWLPFMTGGTMRLTVAIDTAAYWRDATRETRGSLARTLGRMHVAYDSLEAGDDRVTVHAPPAARAILAGFAAQQPTQLSLDEPSPGVFVLSPLPAARSAREALLDSQTAIVLQRRLEMAQGSAVTVAPAGPHKLTIVFGGNADPLVLGSLLGTPGVLNIQVVDEDAARAATPVVPIGDVLLHWNPDNQPPLPVQRRIAIPGADIARASQSFDRNGMPDIEIGLNDDGARALAHLTSTLLSKRMALVLDGKILMAPIVNEPIQGGAMIIAGHFTVAEAQRLAVLISGGGLPAPVHVVSVEVPR
jgi:preprotein translocase subunit SecD